MRVQGCIIAGGQGTRLGGCLKALLPTPAGSSLIQQAIAILTKVCQGPPLLSTNNPAQFPRELAVEARVPDESRFLSKGPLAGLLSTLRVTEADALLFVAGDMPFLDEAVLGSFLGEFRNSEADGIWSVSESFGQPFPSILSKNCVPELEAALEEGCFSLQRVFRSRLSLATWREESKRALDPEGRSFNNINSYADLESYLGLTRAEVLTLLSQQSRAQAH